MNLPISNNPFVSSFNDNCESKSQNENIMEMGINNNSKTVTNEIERGAKLYEERKLAKKDVKLEPLYKIEKEKPFSIYKFYCESLENLRTCIRSRKCKHYGNVIINRDILTPEEHMNFLSKPKYIRRKQQEEQDDSKKYRYYTVKTYPPNATARIEQLSIPNEKRIINTWLRYGNLLNSRQITNLAQMLAASKLTNVAKAMVNIEEEKKFEKIRKTRYKKEAKKIKEKIQQLKGDHVRDIMCSVAEVLRDFLMQEDHPMLAEELEPLKYVILKHIARILCVQVPSDDSNNFVDKFLINLAENLATLTDSFLRSSGLQVFDDESYRWSCENQNKFENQPNNVSCVCKEDICSDSDEIEMEYLSSVTNTESESQIYNDYESIDEGQKSEGKKSVQDKKEGIEKSKESVHSLIKTNTMESGRDKNYESITKTERSTVVDDGYEGEEEE